MTAPGAPNPGPPERVAMRGTAWVPASAYDKLVAINAEYDITNGALEARLHGLTADNERLRAGVEREKAGHRDTERALRDALNRERIDVTSLRAQLAAVREDLAETRRGFAERREP